MIYGNLVWPYLYSVTSINSLFPIEKHQGLGHANVFFDDLGNSRH